MSKYELIGERCKKYWGVIPIVVFVLVRIIVSLIEVSTDSALRSIPQMLLSWFGGISIAILVFWIGRSLFWKNKEQIPRGIRILRATFCVIYCGGIIVAIGIGFLSSVFFYSPEHIVEQNGTRMVASVHSFLQETVYYYEYKNVLFRGTEQIGWKDYGNGGGDPFQQEKEPQHSFLK